MSDQPITISNELPAQLSMQYEYLQELGVKRAQELAGKIWTDYNAHDPGVTMLDAFAYAITDLGYRVSYDIKDLIANDPNDPNAIDIKNFYTARRIMHNCPVTFTDYRKLLMDVDVHQPDLEGCEFVGVKNAWISKASDPECPIYVHKNAEKLSYDPDPLVSEDNQTILDIKVIYDVLLEFERCDAFGDLNANTLEGEMILFQLDEEPGLEGLKIQFDVEFPAWDDEGIDWEDQISIKSGVKNIRLTFLDVPSGYMLEYTFNPDREVWVDVSDEFGPISDDALNNLNEQINQFIYNENTGMIVRYQQKIAKVNEIVDEARATLMANRNLCEDLFKFKAIKIEEIALCTDVEVAADADLVEVHSQIFQAVSNYLSPTVYFYSLEEMVAKGKTTEEIFEGPALEHGFIDDDELHLADQRDYIHASDLIQIIMDVPGVQTVRSLQIANNPLDNDAQIERRSTRWCLKLAVEESYVPRLSLDLSSIIFYKENLPFQPDVEEVQDRVDELRSLERQQKLHDPTLDYEVPKGIYRDIEDYYSVQDEFPIVYGIGQEGLPNTSTDLRQAQAKQMKGYLMFFDQLLADYLAQLAHVKDLFSMNGAKDANNNLVIDKSYFTQTLFESVPNVDPLYVDKPGHAAALQAIAENEELFYDRRNRFLDHLMARFAETFSDYALLNFTVDGNKDTLELIEDKLNFLDKYPIISAARGKAFNYESPCNLWSVDNLSGLNQRASLLSGMDEWPIENLNFSPNFEIIEDVSGGAPYTFAVRDANDNVILTSPTGVSFTSISGVKAALEVLLINGVCNEKYVITDLTGGEFVFSIVCDGSTLADTTGIFVDKVDAEQAIAEAIEVLSAEFYNNTESNRKNLTCPLFNYWDCEVTDLDVDPIVPTFTLNLTLYQEPFLFGTGNTALMTATVTDCEGPERITAQILGVNPSGTTNTFEVVGDLTANVEAGDQIFVQNSDYYTATGGYTVDTVTLVGNNTTLIKVLETLGAPGTGDLGEVLLNAPVDYIVNVWAKDKARDIIWDIISNGMYRQRYMYTDNPYRWNIMNKSEDILASAVATNYNDAVAALFTPGKAFTVTDAADPNITYAYNVLTASANQNKVLVEVASSNAPLPPSALGGTLSFSETYAFSAVKATRTFTVYADVTDKLRTGDQFVITDTFSNDGIYTIRTISLDGSGNTLIVSREPVPADESLGAGQLTFTKSYTIAGIIDDTGALGFDILGLGDELSIADNIQFLTDKFFNHEGMHIIEHTLLRPKYKESFMVDLEDGALYDEAQSQAVAGIDVSIPVARVSSNPNIICVNGNWLEVLSGVVKFDITDSLNNNGQYTIDKSGKGVVVVDGDTCIPILEKLPSDCIVDGYIVFQKPLFVDSISSQGNQITFKERTDAFVPEDLGRLATGFAEKKALEDAGKADFTVTRDVSDVTALTEAEWFTDTAADNPVVKSTVTQDLEAETGKVEWLITDDKGFECSIEFECDDLRFELSEVTEFRNVTTKRSADPSTAEFQMFGVVKNGTREEFMKMTGRTDVSFVQNCIDLLQPGARFEITGSYDELNNGTFSIGDVPVNTVMPTVTAAQEEMIIRPNLLPIDLTNECESCRIEDPYTCIISVVVPYWQGRILNTDFRDFLSRRIRLETPSHIVANVCYINCEQMDEFERKYKAWIIENSKTNKNVQKLTTALNELIDILGRIRNVYPAGVLHDCTEDDDGILDSIILSNSILGNA